MLNKVMLEALAKEIHTFRASYTSYFSQKNVLSL